MAIISFAILFLVGLNGKTFGTSVSYPPFGTFTKDPPFHKRWMLLPQSPIEVGTEFHLFTRSTATNAEMLDSLQPMTIRASKFDASKQTVFISHGFTGGINSPMNKPMTEALLKRADINVVVVAWYNGSHVGYPQAAANCRLVGAQIAHLVEALHKEAGLAYSRVHLIGYSLGAHVMGYAGSSLRKRGHPIARISGLDAAAPLFEHEDLDVRLDESDAEFVDGIHTSTKKVAIATGIGMMKQVGHVDFYVNGGPKQPGCLDPDDGLQKMLSCSHQRSYELFTESITKGDEYRGYPCATYEEFLEGACTSCPPSGCPPFGYDSIQQKGLATGKFYLKTAGDSPYLVDHYKVTFKTGTALFGDLIGGFISIQIIGNKATSSKITFNRRTMYMGRKQSFVAGIGNIGDPVRIKVSHIDPFQKWNLREIMVQKFGSKDLFYICTNVWLNSKNNDFTLVKTDDDKNIDC